MKTLKPGARGEEISILSKFLGIDCIDSYSGLMIDCVKEFQRENNLQVDGIVGPSTWMKLYVDYRGNDRKEISREDYFWIAKIFDLEPESLMAVRNVESCGSGFLSSGRPRILFEAHVFWRELGKEGKNPANYVKGNENILSSGWNKSLYRGGEKEWNRLEKAKRISQEAALKSASWGLFQVMGFNYQKCGSSDIFDFEESMRESEFKQFMLTIKFLQRGNLIKYLRSCDWEGFALHYNGKGYKENSYDTKLQKEYNRLKNN